MFAAASPHPTAPRASLLRRGLDWCARLVETGEPALWTVAVSGRIVGVLNRDGESYRLDWFEGADARLAAYDGPLGGDIARLAAALDARLGSGARVRIVAVPI